MIDMVELYVSQEFEKRYQALPDQIKKKLKKQQHFFRLNPSHPSLNTEKIEPRHRGYWTFRVDDDYRVLFRYRDDDSVLLITVGPHDWIYRRPTMK